LTATDPDFADAIGPVFPDCRDRIAGGSVTPYKSISDLPDSVRDNVPKHAQEIYKEAFNNAWDEYADKDDRRGDASREETAHKVAWSAVKKDYRKGDDDKWHAK
jgi:cation transport regulator